MTMEAAEEAKRLAAEAARRAEETSAEALRAAEESKRVVREASEASVKAARDNVSIKQGTAGGNRQGGGDYQVGKESSSGGHEGV